MALSEWQFVKQIAWPYPGLSADAAAALKAQIGASNSFTTWPSSVQAEAFDSLDKGVALGFVASGYDRSAVVGAAKDCGSYLELRVTWKPPA